jgi:hypothetical protein
LWLILKCGCVELIRFRTFVALAPNHTKNLSRHVMSKANGFDCSKYWLNTTMSRVAQAQKQKVEEITVSYEQSKVLNVTTTFGLFPVFVDDSSSWKNWIQCWKVVNLYVKFKIYLIAFTFFSRCWPAIWFDLASLRFVYVMNPVSPTIHHRISSTSFQISLQLEWNLQFFRGLLPDECFRVITLSGITTLDVIAKCTDLN